MPLRASPALSLYYRKNRTAPGRGASVVVMNLKLRPSYRLAALLACAHVGVVCAVLLLDRSIEVRLVLAFVVALSLIASMQRSALLKTADAIVALEWSEDGAVNFQTRDGTWHAGRLLPTSFVAPMLTVINLRTPERPRVRHIVLMRDSADSEDYRRLRVRLQWDRARLA